MHSYIKGLTYWRKIRLRNKPESRLKKVSFSTKNREFKLHFRKAKNTLTFSWSKVTRKPIFVKLLAAKSSRNETNATQVLRAICSANLDIFIWSSLILRFVLLEPASSSDLIMKTCEYIALRICNAFEIQLPYLSPSDNMIFICIVQSSMHTNTGNARQILLINWRNDSVKIHEIQLRLITLASLKKLTQH